MTAGPVDTPLKLARCPRCGGYVFAANSGGLRVAADPAPATRDAYALALASGRRCFDLLTVAGRPYKLLPRRSGTQPPAFGPEGVQGPSGRSVLVEHGCGVHGMDAARMEDVPPGPPSAPATPGGSRGGILPPDAPGAPVGAPCRSPAVPASRHPSEGLPPFCGVCNSRIRPGESFWGIQYGVRWIYAGHEECP